MAWTAAPDPVRGVGGPAASTSSASDGADFGALVGALRDLLAAFFSAYLEDAPEVRKPQMTFLLAQAHAAGLIGPGALPSLAALFASLRAELDADGSKFSAFYHFIFFVARDKGQRNLPRATALDAWRFVLGIAASPRTLGARCSTSPSPSIARAADCTPTTRAARGPSSSTSSSTTCAAPPRATESTTRTPRGRPTHLSARPRGAAAAATGRTR